MSKITIVNNCKFSSDARVLQVVSKFMSEKIGDDVDYLGEGDWEMNEDEGVYVLTATTTSVAGNVRIKVTCTLAEID